MKLTGHSCPMVAVNAVFAALLALHVAPRLFGSERAEIRDPDGNAIELRQWLR